MASKKGFTYGGCRMKWRKIIRIAIFALLFCLMLTTQVFAAGKDLFEVADNIIRDVYNHIAGISTVLAALMSSIAVIGAKISNNSHKTEQAWDWLKRIWIAWAIINGIGAFIAYVTPLFDGYNVLP